MTSTALKTEPRYHTHELAALDVLEPILSALATAANAIHDAARERAEADYWRTRYNEDLDAQIRHNDTMMANVLTAYLHPLGEPK